MVCCPAIFMTLTDCLVARRTLADAEKINYITAVKCMQSLPALHDHGKAVRTRFDEFQGLHIRVADRVHATVSRLSAHNRRWVNLRFIYLRVNSFLGIDFSYECTKKFCEVSAATMGQYRTSCYCYRCLSAPWFITFADTGTGHKTRMNRDRKFTLLFLDQNNYVLW